MSSRGLPVRILGADFIFPVGNYRRQLYSTYAVQLTTLMPPAIFSDALLWFLLVRGTSDWSLEEAQLAFYVLAGWMTFSKFIKLITHFVRYPVDILLWPFSVLFGWFHGAIKLYAAFTLNEVSRSSRCALDPY